MVEKTKVETLHVDLGDRSYPICIGAGNLSQFDLESYIHGDKALIVTNELIAPLYLETIKARVKNKSIDIMILPDGEQFKNLEYLILIFNKLLEENHDRKTTLIALGGGVIGDMTGFAASCYQRGVPFIQIPTTLLAQVDSSVGGKTGVNHLLGKNMLGSFHQPAAVLIDVDVLGTLSDRQFSSGMAEIIKYGLIADADFFDWIESNRTRLLERDKSTLITAIERSCATKSKIVSADETEMGIRGILNLGHTFGHAIETFQNYRGYLHGEAISAGMLMAMSVSLKEGYLAKGNIDRVENLLAFFDLSTKPPKEMMPSDFKKLMWRDKKVQNGRLRLVLLERLGKALIDDKFSHLSLDSTLENACKP